MPRLWNRTIEAHRRDVRAAIEDAAASLVATHGLRTVTMSQIAETAGIGRATLYKYFPDVEAILVAWHERRIAVHLQRLITARDQAAGNIADQLNTVMTTYAIISRETRQHADADLVAFLHRDKQVAVAGKKVRKLVRSLLNDGAKDGDIRDDVSPDELTSYCLHALGAARTLPSKAAVRRLVTVIMAGLRPRPRARL